jgi:RNA polymerase sigma-70 factor (ECF subfamily)
MFWFSLLGLYVVIRARFDEHRPVRATRDEQAAFLRCCWALTTDRDSARGVAHEAVERARRQWGLEGPRPLTWTRTAALNLVRSDPPTTWAATAEQPSADGADGAAATDVAAALRRLPARQREAVALHDLGEASIGDCAVAMDLTVPTVSALLEQGRSRLAELLFDDTTAVPLTELRTLLRKAADGAMAGVDLSSSPVGSGTG